MITVEHEKRKKKILQKALEVFIEAGYEGATFQKIADRCGLTRTTLYIYFRTKREIFLLCIKQLTDELYVTLEETLEDKQLSAEAALRRILEQIVDCVAANSSLFSVLLVYLLRIKQEGVDPSERITRRVIRLRHILSTVIIRGIKAGEFRPLPLRDANEMFYALVEATVFRLSLEGGEATAKKLEAEIKAVRTALHLAVSSVILQNTDT